MSVFDMTDPQSVGLLSLGLRLMSTPGKLGQALGQSGLGAMNDMQGTMQSKQRGELANLQIQRAQMEQKAAEDAARRQQMIEEAARLSMRTPEQQAMMGGGGPTMANSAKIDPSAGPSFDQNAFLNRLSGIDPLTSLDWRAKLAKQTPQLTVSKPGDIARDPVTGKVLWQNPEDKAAGDKDIALLEMIHGKGTPAFMAAAAQLAQKRTTHQPGVSVSYGQPVAGVDAQGNPVFFQPSKGGGAPAIVPGVKPAPQNRDTKLPAELQRMQIAGDAMGKLLTDYEGMLDKHNPRDPMVQANPTVRAEMQSLKRNLELQFKELQALGALAGPDIEIMRQALSDPFSMQGAYYGRDGLKAQVRQARVLLKNRNDAVLRSQGKPGDQPQNDDPLNLRGK